MNAREVVTSLNYVFCFLMFWDLWGQEIHFAWDILKKKKRIEILWHHYVLRGKKRNTHFASFFLRLLLISLVQAKSTQTLMPNYCLISSDSLLVDYEQQLTEQSCSSSTQSKQEEEVIVWDLIFFVLWYLLFSSWHGLGLLLQSFAPRLWKKEDCSDESVSIENN